MSTPQYPQYPQNPDPQASPYGQQPANVGGGQYPAYAQNPYSPPSPGQYPGYGTPAPVAKPRIPGTVNGAFIIYLLEAVVFIIGLVVTVNSPVWDDAVRDAAANSSTTVDPATVVTTAKTLIIGIFVLFAALFLFFAFMMRAGRNWARIVLTVLSGLAILSGFSAQSSFTANNRSYALSSGNTFNWVHVALSVLAIVLMYLTASNVYFRNSKAYRHRQQ